MMSTILNESRVRQPLLGVVVVVPAAAAGSTCSHAPVGANILTKSSHYGSRGDRSADNRTEKKKWP